MIHLLTALVEWTNNGRQLTIGGTTALAVISSSVIGVATVSLMTTAPGLETGGGPASGGSGPAFPNEPAGFTELYERSFTDTIEGIFTEFANFNPPNGSSIVTDGTAPVSCCSVFQLLWDSGATDGTPGNSAATFSGSADSAAYTSFWVKLDPDWQGNGSGDNKLMYHHIGEGSEITGRVLINAHGTDSGRLFLTLTGGRIANHFPDDTTAATGQCEMTRDTWHQVELIVVADAGAADNGEAYWWLDNNLCAQPDSLDWSDAGESALIYRIEYNGIWGGIPDTVRVPGGMFMRFDHAYTSMGQCRGVGCTG